MHVCLRRGLSVIAAVFVAAIAAPQAVASYGIVGFSPGDGETVTTKTPTFTISTAGFDASSADANPWVAVSTSFQVGTDGTLANTFGCLFDATPTGPSSSTYVAAADAVSWAYCSLNSGATYYWQIWFYTASPSSVDTPLVTCSGATCHTKVMTLVVAQTAPDFTLAAAPVDATVDAPGSASYTIAAWALNGFDSTINLTVAGVPTGAYSSWSPVSGGQTLNISVPRNAVRGTYPLTVTGNGGGITHSVGLSLTIVPAKPIVAAPPDVKRPTVRAFRATAKLGKLVRLKYFVSDNSGRAKVTVSVFKGKKRIARHVSQLGSLPRHHSYAWRASKRGRFKFCVIARDAAGNKSAMKCARVTVK